MSKVTSSQSNLTTGEISLKAAGRYDLAKYQNATKKMENFLINQLGGGSFRPGTRYVAETVDSTKASRVFPFQYSADQDYVVEMGDQYMKFYENDSDTVITTSSPTKFLANFNGLDASKEIVDSGNTGHIVTQVGTAQTSSAQKKFGTTSLLLDGNSDYLTVPDHANWNFGTNDFTIDFWVMFNSVAASSCFYEQYEGAASYTFLSWDKASNRIYITMAGELMQGYWSFTPVTGTWYHIALVRNGVASVDNWKLYVNGFGSSITLTAGVVGASIGDYAAVARIGFDGASGLYHNGYMEEYRISNSARWAADFDTALPTVYTSDANTLLLLHMDSLDITGNNALTFVADAQIDTAQKKYGTASLRLDGTGDYATVPDSSNWDITTGDYTISGFFMIDDLPGAGIKQTLVSQYASATSYWELGILNTAGTYSFYFKFYNGSAQTVTVDFTTLSADTFYHLAMSKKGSSYYFFQDGTQLGATQINVLSVSEVAGVLQIGAYNGANNPYDGWIDDLRIDKGYARYIADFTAPAAEGTVSTITTTSITTTYLEADLFDIHYAQSNDVMYLTHPDYPPRKLSRTDATTFTIADVVFIRGPLLDTNTTTTTITPSSATGATTLTASAAIFDAGHVGSLWRVNSAAAVGAIVKITGYTSPTVVTGTVQAEPDGVAGNIGGTGAYTNWAEGAFSAYRGYPATCVFHEQRLYYANTAHEPQKFWGSYIGAYDSFDTTATTANYSLAFEVATEQRNAIQWMSSGKTAMIIGTNGGTFSASTGSTTEPISPTNILVQRDTNYGVSNLLPQRISSFLYYTQRDLNRVRELAYSFERDAQLASDMTLLAEHILIDGSGVVDIAHQQSPNDRIWCVRSDGEMAVLTRNPEQDVMGWCRIVAGSDAKGPGLFESVCVIPKQNQNDQVWVVVKRNINGTSTRFIEYFTIENFDEDWDAVQLDCSLTLDSPKTITGCTTASPGVVACTTHGFTTGDQVKINGVRSILSGTIGSMIEGEYLIVEGADADHFTLKTLLGVAIDTTSLGTYISGGEVRKMVTAISGLTHLNGEVVSVQTDAYYPTTETYTVAGGAITLSDKAAVVHVGLPYKGTLQLLKLSDGNPKGTGQTQTRRIYLATLRLYRTQGLSIGRTETTLDNLLYDDTNLYTGDVPKVFQTTWSREDECIIRQDKPLAATILSIIFESEVSG